MDIQKNFFNEKICNNLLLKWSLFKYKDNDDIFFINFFVDDNVKVDKINDCHNNFIFKLKLFYKSYGINIDYDYNKNYNETTVIEFFVTLYKKEDNVKYIQYFTIKPYLSIQKDGEEFEFKIFKKSNIEYEISIRYNKKNKFKRNNNPLIKVLSFN